MLEARVERLELGEVVQGLLAIAVENAIELGFEIDKIDDEAMRIERVRLDADFDPVVMRVKFVLRSPIPTDEEMAGDEFALKAQAIHALSQDLLPANFESWSDVLSTLHPIMRGTPGSFSFGMPSGLFRRVVFEYDLDRLMGLLIQEFVGIGGVGDWEAMGDQPGRIDPGQHLERNRQPARLGPPSG
jgi:hypothetical protein